MFMRDQRVPRRVRTEARFQAADPWNGDAPAEFSIEAYEVLPERRGGAPPLHALRSGVDGVERFLPDALSHLWKTGKVAAEALPGLLREMEPDLAQTDFQPILGAPAEPRVATVLTLLLVAVLGAVLAWHSGGHGRIPWLALVLGLGGVAGALFTLLPYCALWERRRRQMGWAIHRLGGVRA